MKNFDPHDPKWTAYVLNELPPRATKTVEQEIKDHPEARALVDSIRTTTSMIEASLRGEPEVEMDIDQKNAVKKAAEEARRGRTIRFPVWIPAALSAAAVLILAVLGVQRFSSSPRMTEWSSPGNLAHSTYEQTHRDGDMNYAAGRVDHGRRISSGAEMVSTTREYRSGSFGSPVPDSSQALYKRQHEGRTFTKTTYHMFAPRSGEVETFETAVISPSLDDFAEIRPNTFIRVVDHPLSTFSIDVDTASYAVVRKFLAEGRLPPPDAVRIEELVNYFNYQYPGPIDQTPFAAHMEAAPAPWQTNHYLIRVALKGREIPAAERPALNLTYLIDVSGSMNDANRLPLVKRALQALVKQLDERDRVAIVVYAGAAGLVLPPTSGQEPQRILSALEQLQAGGSTAGGAGIQLAYDTARKMYLSNAVNRVILCTDGDFNVGLTQRGDLERLIEQEATSGVFLTVLGFGMGNYKDATLELLSNKGNGNYGYIDDFSEARKLLVDQIFGTLITIAKDVKIQVEFNPLRVAAYKLIGYENRVLAKEDFNNDKMDAGEIGAGHTVTALYEIIPAGQPVPEVPAVDALKYQAGAASENSAHMSGEIMTLKLRYKEPDGMTSRKLEFPLAADVLNRMDPSEDFRFASAVAGFGMLLRSGKSLNGFAMSDVLRMAETATGADPGGYRAEFIRLIRNASALQ